MKDDPDEPDSVQQHKRHLWQTIKHRYNKFLIGSTPQQSLLYGFLFYTVLGWLVLCIPLAHTLPVGLLDNLFIATSAISTTGLTTVSVSDSYNGFGQFVIMLLFQIGGIGYMTFTSFVLLSQKSHLSNRHQKVLNTEFSLPKGFLIKDFIRSVIVFTIFMETVGAVLFFIAFTGAGMGTWAAMWNSVFHSVSAFCTAGFGLYNNSFEDYSTHHLINFTICFQAICGSLGFIVVTDLWNRLRGNTVKISYTTKVIFLMFIVLSVVGTLIIVIVEPSVRYLPLGHQLLASFFQAVTALTTVGFNTIPIGALTTPVLLFLVFLMYIGASPSGTGGGLKSTTFTTLIAIMFSRLRGKKRVTFIGKKIPLDRMYIATSSFIFYTAILFFAVFLLSFSESFSLEQILFEAASALGTVGLSTGITGGLTAFGKVVLIIAMFIGRLGVITFGLAVLQRRSQSTDLASEEDLAV